MYYFIIFKNILNLIFIIDIIIFILINNKILIKIKILNIFYI